MPVALTGGVKYEGKEPNFSRDQFNTLEEMFAFPGSKLPQIFHAMNLEDGCMWFFNKSNEADPVTGKWRKFEGGGSPSQDPDSGGVAGEDCKYTATNTTVNMANFTSMKNFEDFTFSDFMKAVTHKAGSLTITITGANSVYKSGSIINLEQNPITVKVTKNNGTSPIGDITIKEGSHEPVILTDTDTYTLVGTNGKITSTLTITASANTADGEKVSASKSISFVTPWYYGVSSVAPPTADVIVEMTEKLETYNGGSIKVTAANQYIVFAVPSGKTIKKIVDENTFDNTSDFNISTVKINDVDYTVYVSANRATCTNFGYTLS